MLKEISEILTHSRSSLVEDVIGVIVLFVFLFVGLSLTGTA